LGCSEKLLQQNHQWVVVAGVVVVILHSLRLLLIVVDVVVGEKRCDVRVKTLPLLLVTFLGVICVHFGSILLQYSLLFLI